MTPGIHDPHRDRPVPTLIVAGLGAQLVGVAAQAAFHLTSGHLPWLTETRTSVLDHVVSNAGVLCLAWQTARWLHQRSAWSTPGRRLMVTGTGIEVAGAVADGIGHVAGGESRVAFAAIGVGFILVTTGAAISTWSVRRRWP
jgi:4-amino-4-deoxy-L-arabinose transferase-like glycosyltransferase